MSNLNNNIENVKKEIGVFIGKNRKIFLFLLVIIIAFLSFGRALDYNFWRDDWGVLWMAKYQPQHFILKWSFGGKHPGEFINTIPLIYLFDTNPKLWQLYGLFIKILASFSVGLLVYSLTNSKKIFWISTLLFASYYGGLEAFTWHSAKLSAYLIILVCSAFYYYSLSYKNENRWIKKYLLFLLFLLIAFLIEPGRAIIIPVIFTIWEFLKRFIDQKIFRKTFILRIILMFVLGAVVLSRTRFGRGLFSGSDASSLVQNADKLKFFFNSVGNLFISTFISVKEQGGLVSGDFQNEFISLVGIIFLAILLTFSVIFLIKKKNQGVWLTFITIWIFTFYLPSWSFEKTLVVGPSHRYLAVSSVGIIILYSLIISKLPRKIYLTLFILLLTINLVYSQQIVNNNYEVRGFGVTQALYDVQEKDVPKDFKQGIFIVEGNNKIRGYAFDWAVAGTTTFALKRNIDTFEDLPMKVSNYGHAAKLVCEQNVRRQYLNYWDEQPELVPISKVYAWYLNNKGEMLNNTDNARIKIAHIADCYHKTQNTQLTQNIELLSSVYLKDTYDENNQVLSFNWLVDKEDYNLIVMDFLIYDKKDNLILKKTSEINLENNPSNVYTNLYFSKILKEPDRVLLKVRKYGKNDLYIDSGYKEIYIN